MEQNNKTLLVAVLIILLALVAFNFNKISGKAVGSDVSVVVSPSVVEFGSDDTEKYITVTVDTGSVGIDNKLSIDLVTNGYNRRVGDEGRERLCGTKGICTGVISKQLALPATLESGDYLIEVERSSTAYNFKAESNTFTIRHI